MLRDFYEGFYFRQDAGKNRGKKGRDLRQNLKVSFKDAALGSTAEIHIPFLGVCQQCRGTGIRAGSKMAICPQCRGRGRRKTARSQLCTACKGSGKTATAPCPRCKGKGAVWSERPVQIRIPGGCGNRSKASGPWYGAAGPGWWCSG